MKILISNRGEIARRINRTIKKLGHESLLPYVEGDMEPFLHEFTKVEKIKDEKFYLSTTEILTLAKKLGAEAIHPGYGYLSEAPDFAEAVGQAGLTFIGPTPTTLLLAGKKDRAKELAKNKNVPILESYPLSESTDLVELTKNLKFPIIIKAVSGGGGRGMRRTNNLAELKNGIVDCANEGKLFFGNGDLIAERFLEEPRHIEVQILGLRNGKIIPFGTRDCSIQRRFQKVIEIAPAQNLSSKQEQDLINYALALGVEFNLIGLATVEFLVKDKEIFFIEINPRLQVEHPITEEIYGIDLVELQIQAVLGTLTSFTPHYNNRHSIELRVCAEDEDFKPTTGILKDLNLARTKLRTEHALFEDKEITTRFDSMIAKIITTAESHDLALQTLSENLMTPFFWGIKSNLNYLYNKVSGKDSLKLSNEEICCCYFALANGDFFRVSASQNLNFKGYLLINRELVEYELARQGSNEIATKNRNYKYQIKEDQIVFGSHHIYYKFIANYLNLYLNGDTYEIKPGFPNLANNSGNNSLLNFLNAPLPGKIADINCSNGQKVTQGTCLIKLESMKSIFELTAPKDGTISKLTLSVGEFIQAGELILEII